MDDVVKILIAAALAVLVINWGERLTVTNGHVQLVAASPGRQGA